MKLIPKVQQDIYGLNCSKIQVEPNIVLQFSDTLYSEGKISLYVLKSENDELVIRLFSINDEDSISYQDLTETDWNLSQRDIDNYSEGIVVDTLNLYNEIEYFYEGKSLYKTCLQDFSTNKLRKCIAEDYGIEIIDRMVLLSRGVIRLDSDTDEQLKKEVLDFNIKSK